jgi:hypothetical protein
VYVSRVVDLLSEAKTCPGVWGGVCLCIRVCASGWVFVLVFVGVDIACVFGCGCVRACFAWQAVLVDSS